MGAFTIPHSKNKKEIMPVKTVNQVAVTNDILYPADLEPFCGRVNFLRSAKLPDGYFLHLYTQLI
ncbi:hypothetical protein [Mucilaginibacter terrigena]|uniref:hypothetical protein n=1 Tax=Mucilaginibacter terrigena TaxID=2492395 RepID=UPI001939776D|nr:hypothetical protein [Mucilaginibacter terrigena]